MIKRLTNRLRLERGRRRFGSFGPNTVIHTPQQIVGALHIHFGQGVFVREGARLDAITEWEGTKFSPAICIGDGCHIENRLQITATHRVELKNNVLVASNVFITDNAHSYEDIETPVKQQPLKSSPVSIGEHSWLGQNVVIMPGVNLGKHCIVGANAVVRAGTYPDYSLLAGVPAKIIKRYNHEKKAWIKA